MDERFLSVAARLLESSVSSRGTLRGLVVGVHVASRRLAERLEPILGSLGVRLIMERAVRIASVDCPFLQSVAVYEDGLDADSVLAEKTDTDYEDVRCGFERLLGSSLVVLSEMVGKELALELVQPALDGERKR